jgi:hypothetical protein
MVNPKEMVSPVERPNRYLGRIQQLVKGLKGMRRIVLQVPEASLISL